jgi:hypothetical protein
MKIVAAEKASLDLENKHWALGLEIEGNEAHAICNVDI